ncbi:MAG: RDD family protein [Bryobacteraceae bacterium]
MTCVYCGAHNTDDDRRCQRCGRKPGDTLSGQASHLRTEGALAAVAAPQAAATQPAEKHNLSRAVQGLLFPKRPDSNVIPFESYFAEAMGKPGRQAHGRDAEKTPRKPSRPPARRTSENQAWLNPEWAPVKEQPLRTLTTTVEAKIYCDVPVAARLHRAVSSVLDWSMVLLGYALLLTAYGLMGGGFQLNRMNMLVFAGMLGMVAFTYSALFALAGKETPGMNWTHLRLTTFEGFRPSLRQRIYRFLGSCLSLSTVFGMAWPLCDEESLSLPDHISRTFLTAAIFDTAIFRRG